MLRAVILLRVLPLAALLAGSAARAQDLSPISGKVVDGKGVPIPGATVRLFAGETGPPIEEAAFHWQTALKGTPTEHAQGVRQVSQSVTRTGGRLQNGL